MMITAATGTQRLLGARLADGRVVDVLVVDGVIAQVAAAGELGRTGVTAASDALGAAGGGLGSEPAPLDLTGYVLLPSAAEPHAHLDKALLADRAPNPTGDLLGAIDAVQEIYPSMTESDIGERARRALSIAVSHGYTAVRTHVDCGDEHGLRSVHALGALRDAMADVVDLQVVALMRPTITGDDGHRQLRMLRAALDEGADLVGGVPHLEPEPMRATRLLVEIAAEAGRDMDLHTDEATDPSVAGLAELARLVISTGFPGRVTASHCVSLGVQPLDEARRTAALVAEAGIGIVALPQTNLYLQGRDRLVGKERGLTAIEVLLEAGVTVAAGGDNWRDPFNPMSRIDPLETASLMVTAGHRLPADAYRRVSTHVRTVLGAPAVEIAPGHPADLLAVRGSSLTEAMAAGSAQRMVLRAGRVVATSQVTTTLDPLLAAAVGAV